VCYRSTILRYVVTLLGYLPVIRRSLIPHITHHVSDPHPYGFFPVDFPISLLVPYRSPLHTTHTPPHTVTPYPWILVWVPTTAVPPHHTHALHGGPYSWTVVFVSNSVSVD